jgi:hypothetical protein
MNPMPTLQLLAALLSSCAIAAPVTLLSVPNKGVQPQALVDASGQLHLVFLAGPAAQSDVFHTTLQAKTQTFTEAQRVNHTPGNAMAIGSIRGAQCAFGRDHRLHIVWNGKVTDADGKSHSDVLYTRSDGHGGFEPERPLMHLGMYLDGGASIAADPMGNVYAMWHAAPNNTPKGAGEMARRVYLAASHDDGKTFATETLCNAPDTGVCGCCSMRAIATPTGELFAIYRSADGSSRGIQTLRSKDKARTFDHAELQPWPVNACPMSSSFMQPTAKGVLAAWETDNTIWMASLSAAQPNPIKVSAKGSKHPSIAQNEHGDTLVAWAIGTGWQRGGTLAWSLRTSAGDALDEGGDHQTASPGNGQHARHDFSVPVWSYPAAAHVPGMGFVILH